MRRSAILSACLLMAATLSAKTLNVTSGSTSYVFPATSEPYRFVDGDKVAIGDQVFPLAEFTVLRVGADWEYDQSTVLVSYQDDKAEVQVYGDLAPYVEVSVEGAHVTITQGDEVGADTTGELTYVLVGESSDGSFTLEGSYKSTVELRGLTLTNPKGAAIDLQNGKRIAVSAKNGTVNTLVDGDGSQKAALYCKGHLELKGKGELNVLGTAAHAISAKEYIEIKNLTLNITGAKKDGLNCNQYFAMESGDVTISGTGDDGIQVSFKDDTDREAEDTGSFSITGGSIDIHVAKGEASKGIKADGDIDVSGGDIKIVTDCDGMWDSAKLKTKASACLGADGDIAVNGGTLSLTATGSGGKGISCDGTFRSTAGDVTIATSGGMLVYSGGSLNHNYTGSSDRIDSDYKSSAKGIKADTAVEIAGGKFHVTTSSNNAEGIESKGTLEISDGELFVKAYDDGLNSASDMRVSGGDLTVIAVMGDGLDSNANLYISGGTVRTFGGGGAEMGLDAADETGCAVYFTGGTILSYGGRNCTIARSGSTQAYVSATGSITANSTVSVKNGDNVLVEFTIPAEYSSSGVPGPGFAPGGGGWGPGGGGPGGMGGGSLMVSFPELVSGQSYTLVNGSTSSNVTARLQ